MRYLLYLLLLSACNNQNTSTTETEHSPAVATQDSGKQIEILDPEALRILDSATTIDVLAGGFNWTEGPLPVSEGGYFIFSDIPENKIYKWKEGDSVTVFLQPAGYTGTMKKEGEQGSNGLLLHPDGHLVLMQHGDRRVAKMTAPLSNPKPEFVTLADRFEGKRLNSPNDGVYHPNGDLYFTDPPYGLAKGIDDPAKELDFQGVYRLKPNGHLDLLTKELKYPNGITLSPDSRYLYVANSDQQNLIWMQYELNEQGLIKNGHLFFEVREYEGKEQGAPDGMKMNRSGYLFATGPEGLWLFNPAGKLIARVYTGHRTSNCALSPDEKTLYLTCDDYIVRMKLK